MKYSSIAMAIAIGLVVVGCGGGGGGSTGSGNTGGSNAGGSTTAPVTNTPVVSGTATYAGERGFYRISRVGSGYQVVDTRLNETSSVTAVQAIRFSDITINLGIGDKAATIDAAKLKSLIELYMAFLKRVPDADSLAALIDQSNAGQTLTQIADRLHAEAVLAPDLTGMGAAMIHSEFVTVVYKDVFGMFGVSAPAASDVAYWSGRIDKGGISRGALVVAMLDSARSAYPGLSSAPVIGLLDNRAAVGDYVAVQQGVNYNSAEESISRRRAIAAAVTSTDKTTAQSLLGFSDASFNLKLSGK